MQFTTLLSLPVYLEASSRPYTLPAPENPAEDSVLAPETTVTKKSLAATEASIRARMDADMKEILDQLVKVAKAVKKMQVSEAPQKKPSKPVLQSITTLQQLAELNQRFADENWDDIQRMQTWRKYGNLCHGLYNRQGYCLHNSEGVKIIGDM